MIADLPPVALETELTLVDFTRTYGPPATRHTSGTRTIFGWWTTAQYVELTCDRDTNYVAAWSRPAPDDECQDAYR